MNRKSLFKVVFAGIMMASLITACAQPEEVEVTRIVTEEVEKLVEVEVTRIVTEMQEVEVTRIVPAEAEPVSPASLTTLAKQILDGEIDVGDEYGMAVDQRFHVIHADVVGMSCRQCHVEEAVLEVAQPANITEEAPGPVDRRVCLGCHLTGPATKLYEPKE